MFIRLLSSLLIFHTSFVYGANLIHKKFNHITSDDGLSQSAVTSIHKDSNGYYWFGTQNGLNRYDGYSMKVFRNEKVDKNSISKGEIVTITEDPLGKLWILSSGILNRYDLEAEHFKRYGANDGFVNTIDKIALEGEDLWISMGRNLYVFNTVSEQLELQLDFIRVRDFLVTKEIIWLLGDDGLHSYNRASDKLEKFGHSKEYGQSTKPVKITRLLKHKEYLWLGTRYGLVVFNTVENRFEENSHQLPGKIVVNLAVDSSGSLWIATLDSGIYNYSLESGDLIRLGADISDHYQLLDNSIKSMFVNEDGLWVGTVKGVSYMRLNSSVGFIRAKNNGLSDNLTTSIKKDSTKGLWIGSSTGLTRLNDKMQKKYPVGWVGVFYFGHTTLWAVGSKGVFKYDRIGDQFVKMNSSIPDLAARYNQTVFDILEFKKDQFLLVTNYSLIKWNSISNESHPIGFSDKKSKFGRNPAVNLYKMGDKVFVSGAKNGFYIFNTVSEEIEKFESLPKNSESEAVFINDIDYVNGLLWISTNDGLFLLKDGNQIAQYTKENGLPDIIVRLVHIVDDVIWLATDLGLAAFRLNGYELEKIHLNHSELKIEFNGGASYYDKENSLLYLPSTEGVVYFNPEELSKTNLAPKTTITDFHLFSQPIQPGSELLSRSISLTNELTLSHNQNMLTFEFSSLNFNQPDHLYAYQLDGLHYRDDWVVTDTKNRRATFTPGPGEYTFRVKSGWDKNTWSDDITELKVEVLPPWWHSRWAYTIYIALLLLSIFSYIRIRTSTLSKRAKELEVVVGERTEELKNSNQELQESNQQLNKSHQQIEVLLERKNILFANTSHELRTPLTLILGPINNLLKSCTSEQKQDLLLAKRNTERLVHLVDQLLELARISSPTQDEFNNTDLSDILSLVIHSMHSLLQERDIKLSHNIEDNIIVSAIPDALDIIVLNLLSNAVKYTEPGGDIQVRLSKRDSNAVFCVKDTGIGIAKPEQTQIYEKFTRLDEARHRDIPGSGIGLALVKELLDLHHGNIELVSELGQGSEFTITLPLSKTQFQQAGETGTPQPSEKKVATIKSFLSVDRIHDRKSPQVISSETQATASEEKPSLLIVDDIPDMLNYLQQLTSQFYNCTAIDNGIDAIKYAEEHSPDLILCDVMMPGMDGFEVLQSLRENIQTSHIPIILLTAKGDKLSRLKGYHAQVDDYIAKPFDTDELLARMDSLIKNRQNLREVFSQALNSGKLDLDANNNRLVKKDQEFLIKFQTLIEAQHHQHGYTLTEMAQTMHMSESSLQKKLKAITGSSPIAYLNQYRLQQAGIYLKESDLPIQTILEKVGFSDAPNFTRLFKKHYGKTPKEYRDKNN